VAKECQPTSGWRLIARTEPMNGTRPPSTCIIATCGEGTSTRIGTRRRRSHGNAMPEVPTASSTSVGASGGAGASVPTQTNTSTAQPQNRCVTSNASWARVRTGGNASSSMARRSTMTAYAGNSGHDATSPRTASAVSTATKARYHTVPQTAAPTCTPPKW
jgi:hypothetical protein